MILKFCGILEDRTEDRGCDDAAVQVEVKLLKKRHPRGNLATSRVEDTDKGFYQIEIAFAM